MFLRGISTGFKGIDYVTGGFQPEQFVVLIGLPKSMKSSTLLTMAHERPRPGQVAAVHRFRDEQRGAERPARRRCYTGVGLTKILNGTVTQGRAQADRRRRGSCLGVGCARSYLDRHGERP